MWHCVSVTRARYLTVFTPSCLPHILCPYISILFPLFVCSSSRFSSFSEHRFWLSISYSSFMLYVTHPLCYYYPLCYSCACVVTFSRSSHPCLTFLRSNSSLIIQRHSQAWWILTCTLRASTWFLQRRSTKIRECAGLWPLPLRVSAKITVTVMLTITIFLFGKSFFNKCKEKQKWLFEMEGKKLSHIGVDAVEYIHTCMHTCIHAYIRTYIHVCIQRNDDSIYA